MRKLFRMLNTKATIPQIIFLSAFVATVLTVVDLYVEWDRSIYAGLFAGLMTLIGIIFAKIIFRDEN